MNRREFIRRVRRYANKTGQHFSFDQRRGKESHGTVWLENRLSDAALAGRLGLNESTVQKLVNPDHRSHISHVMKALRAVGRDLVTEDRAA